MSRELDTEIAQKVMGWAHVERGHYKPDGNRAGVWHPLPRFSVSLDACAQAEARIVAMGNGDAYGRLLARATNEEDWTLCRRFGGDHWANIATASPEVRCRAMFKSLP